MRCGAGTPHVGACLARGPGGVSAALGGAVRNLDPAVAVVAPGAYRAALNTEIAQNTWTIHVFVIVLLVYVVIAALNTLIMAALARREETAVLRLAGVSRGQILRMHRAEQTVLLGLALVAGGGVAALTLVPMVHGTTGSASVYIPAAGWAAVIVGTILVGMVGTLLPIRKVLRSSPIETIGRNE